MVNKVKSCCALPNVELYPNTMFQCPGGAVSFPQLLITLVPHSTQSCPPTIGRRYDKILEVILKSALMTKLSKLRMGVMWCYPLR